MRSDASIYKIMLILGVLKSFPVSHSSRLDNDMIISLRHFQSQKQING